MKCGNCGEPPKNVISVLAKRKVDDPRNAPNLVMKCKFCERVGSATVITNIWKPLTEALSVFRESAPLVQVECKGFDPVEFVFRSGWKAKSVRKVEMATGGEDIILAIKETLRYGPFLGTYAGTFVSVDELIAAVGGHHRLHGVCN